MNMLTISEEVSMQEGYYMTTKEIERAEIFAKAQDKRLSQADAAKTLNANRL
jgi:hypothetical protein